MKKLILLALFIAGCSKEPINVRILVERDDVMYTNDTNKPYSGAVFSLYRDGQKKWEGSLKEGKQIGRWTKYYESGNKKIEENYQDGEEDGKYTEYYESGQISSEGNHKDGKLDGKWLWYYENGQIEKKENYKGEGSEEMMVEKVSYSQNGDTLILEKPLDKFKMVREYYENGQLKQDGIYKDGKEDGKWTYYNENGQIMKEENYKDGKEDGKWTYYNENGQIMKEENYKDGKEDGKYTEYYESGQISSEGNHKDGKLDGKWTYYNENSITATSEYKYGQLVTVTLSNRNIDFSSEIRKESTDSGIQMVIYKEGNGQRPRKGQTVVVHYTGFLETGKKFDSSHDRSSPISFPLGQGRVIKGWDEAIALMSKGEKRTLIIPPDLGYGSQDKGRIPPNSTLIFEVELVDYR